MDDQDDGSLEAEDKRGKTYLLELVLGGHREGSSKTSGGGRERTNGQEGTDGG